MAYRMARLPVTLRSEAEGPFAVLNLSDANNSRKIAYFNT